MLKKRLKNQSSAAYIAPSAPRPIVVIASTDLEPVKNSKRIVFDSDSDNEDETTIPAPTEAEAAVAGADEETINTAVASKHVVFGSDSVVEGDITSDTDKNAVEAQLTKKERSAKKKGKKRNRESSAGDSSNKADKTQKQKKRRKK